MYVNYQRYLVKRYSKNLTTVYIRIIMYSYIKSKFNNQQVKSQKYYKMK